MQNEILKHLKDVEAEQECRVLYACESGSRAWGFPSPDSDFDIRFIYVHKPEWYLRLEKKPDTYDIMAPGDLDISGWELAKMLRLFAGCNLALNEWFDSPEIYYEKAGFPADVRALIPNYFNVKKAVYHYLSMAQTIVEKHLRHEEIPIKKAFYILRPLLACTYILEHRSMPPTQFGQLLKQPITPDLKAEIEDLLKAKKTADEGELILLSEDAREWITSQIEQINSSASDLETCVKPDWEPLNKLMLKWTGLVIPYRSV